MGLDVIWELAIVVVCYQNDRQALVVGIEQGAHGQIGITLAHRSTVRQLVLATSKTRLALGRCRVGWLAYLPMRDNELPAVLKAVATI
jgi:hypothetical protein